VDIAPGLRRVLARNPNPFTFYGSGTYVVGRGCVAVIDPGPLLDEHVAALTRLLAGETVTHILVTHTHGDHSPAAAPLKATTSAPTHGFGPHGGARRAAGIAVEEGGDLDFVPDIAVHDGEIIAGDGWSFECVHTPGHTSNHVCYAWREANVLFSGDHVMGWSTTVIVPPDGDMAAYFASLQRLAARDDRVYYPTHGNPVRDPRHFVTQLLAHRRAREAQVEVCLRHGIGVLADIVRVIYSEVDPGLHPAAAMSIRAHLLHMQTGGRVIAQPAPDGGTRYALL
jgi:glyoxylase-like metal-dependent hydrolase (beta-lactamase superfamily II)